MAARPDVKAWRPSVGGVAEVFHARFTDHAYPMHTHDAWTLLLVDDGVVRYDLDRHEHGALNGPVTILPPHVPHNGCSATPGGFRKRVLYLEAALLDDGLIGSAVDGPTLDDPVLRRRVHRLHGALALPGEEFEAEGRLALILDRLRWHLRHRVPPPPPRRDRRLARGLRGLLDERVRRGVTLEEAAALLHAHPTHLVRAFGREFGMAPHQYLTARRIDLARRLLLAGQPAGAVAAAAGFYDQSHLTRHFRRVVGTTPGHYARAAGRRRSASG
ncbi:AraC family transcriptional regulator [Actinorugispora endophytica]|uniref:AraC-like DNA-binding protein n=1 Tax=Actinorugispora endophytica TaxID=1605990 RepID=A0A4R6VEF2_9ACTN|nr:AraC family transcriptional regulator [Actinorugispora endophytica]TDQ55417.1 AraC-like DNA-binding protein [Actinorugispora endophytica]